MMLARAVMVWCLLLGLAVVNGGIRESWIIPRAGAAGGHAISTVALCVLILLLSLTTIRWIRPVSGPEAWAIGGVWLGLTLGFEFLAGHYLFGNSWSRLLDDYNILAGRIWVLVLSTTAAAPWLAARARGLVMGAERAEGGGRRGRRAEGAERAEATD
jgi:hypothetical protein